MIAIVDYGIEKDNSLIKLLSKLKIDFKVTNRESEILHSDKIILPHTNNISSAVKQLHLLNLFTMLRLCNKPILGISAGMHLMSAHTKEGNLTCLGIFPGTIEKYDETNENVLSNESEIILVKQSKLFEHLSGDEIFCFESSYYLPVDQYTSAVRGNVPIISAAIEKNNFFGIQFLPEKSGEAGIKILKNFVDDPF